MEKEAKMPVTADQRPLWNTQRRSEESSPLPLLPLAGLPERLGPGKFD
jgi:hypothetical protein